MTETKNQESSRDLRSKKMREQPIGKLLLSMSLPAMFSMLVQALYNVVDTMFVSSYDKTNGLTALSVAFPMQMFFMAFAIGIGVGTNVQIAKKLGEDRQKDASHTAQTGIVMALIMAVVTIILGLTVVKPFVRAYSDSPEVNDMAVTYLTIVMCLSFGMFVEICCSKILQSTGNMKAPMVSQLIGAITNIILDPIFIFDWGLGLGVAGAALATVSGQLLAMCYVLTVMFKKKQDVSISLRGFRPKKHVFLEIMVVGLPTTIMNAMGSITTSTLNLIIKKHVGYIAILGAYFKLNSFVFMPVFGLTQGALPIMSYNYGYGDKKRFFKTFRLSVCISFGIMLAGTLLFQICPELLLKIFSLPNELMGAGAGALRKISLSFVPAAITIVMVTAFQSLTKGVNSLLMSLLRQLGFLIPCAFVLDKFVSGSAVWFCYPIAEVMVLVIFLPILLYSVKKMFRFKNEALLREERSDGQAV